MSWWMPSSRSKSAAAGRPVIDNEYHARTAKVDSPRHWEVPAEFRSRPRKSRTAAGDDGGGHLLLRLHALPKR
jgi:hypothetical protein